MTVSQIEPHHQNDNNCYEGPEGSKARFADFVLPHDLEVLQGNAAEEYPDYLGQCASLDENLGKLVAKLKEKGLYELSLIHIWWPWPSASSASPATRAPGPAPGARFTWSRT